MTQKNKILTEKDVCIVIATYNRSEDLDKTLKVLYEEKNVPGRILIVDQSKNNKTKEITKKFEKKLPVTYIFSKIPSSSIAKNKGIAEAKKGFPIILILDDDVDLLKGFLSEMVNEFNKSENLMALGGGDANSVLLKKLSSKTESFILKMFFLSYPEDHRFRVIGPYGVTGSPILKKPITEVEWLPGFNTAFRREVFDSYKMPESKGYNVLEDIDSTYHVFKKYGPRSLIITPKCNAHHRASIVARYTERKRIFINHEDHFYFYYAHFNDLKGMFKLAWSLTGLIAGNIAKYMLSPSKENFSAMRYNLEAIFFCIGNRENIKKGRLRTFLDEDLSMNV
jgi:GT2 family glycosyltransferase